MAFEDTLLLPITAESPSGVSLRYSAVFDQIREARREDDDLPQGDWGRPRKTADLDLLIRLTGEVLATQSKDLQIAAWRTEALLRRIGIPGLTEGLNLVRELIERFWDSLYPEIEDGDLEYRAGPLDWIGSRLGHHVRRVPVTARKHDWYAYQESRAVPYETADEAAAAKRAEAVAEGKTTPDDFETGVTYTQTSFYESLLADVNGALLALRELENVCQKHFYDEVSFNELRRALEDLHTLAYTLLAPRRSAEQPYATGGAEDTTPGFSAPRSETVSLDSVLVYAATLRRDRAWRPLPYLLLRAARWAEVRETSDTDKNVLQAPATSTRVRLAAAAREEKWESLLELSETEMATPAGRGWLDLQRYSCNACEGLGPLYSEVHDSIVAETRALVGQFPELPRALLSDGTPAADAATLEWLNKLQSANPALERSPEGEMSGRIRFVARLQMAKDCLAGGQTGVAAALLEELTQEADRRALDQWESPDLIVEPFLLLFQILGSQTDSVERRRTVFNRICRLHPRMAIAQNMQEPHA